MRAFRRWAGATSVAVVLGSAACTVLLDHGNAQCQSDADCVKYGGHPSCVNQVCVPSGFQPTDCFLGTPQRQQDFLNQCSTVQCQSFDDCMRLGLCSDADPPLVAPPTMEAGAGSSSGAGMDAGPMKNCLDANPTEGRAQVVYITGSSNFPPLLSKLAPVLFAQGTSGPVYTPVFLTTSSCTGVKSMFSMSTSDRFINDPKPGSSLSKYATYFSADGKATPCLLGPGGAQVDVGESDIFSTTCSGFGAPGDAVNDSLGPIQAMAFVVPAASLQTTISAAAAREVFGMGGNDMVATPWTDPARFLIRNSGTGTQQMIGRAIKVPADQFWGVDQGTASTMDQQLKLLNTPDQANQTIGIISVDYYDADRGSLKALAFKATDQECAYLPDSTADSTDKRNVRDGHYPIWGPLHFFSSNNPTSPAAAAFLSVVTETAPTQAVLDAFIGASLIPTCAMSVQRTTELGDISPYGPPKQCGCYFESKRGSAPAQCMPCQSNSDCPAARSACNYGFCEVQ